MDWKKIVSDLNEWQDQETAPLDGTPVIVDCSGSLGVFAWEDRPECLPATLNGKPMRATWVGFFIATDLNPMEKDGAFLPQRFMTCVGIDEPFKWRPLPARATSTL